ncbi:SDR family NAD(P)-dependent oxidoreductase [Deinococcus apachensis]|uniref:SDR family NAD(P)-dependent oxidoreductase n=1 Tax=Deinococcus apachensis TaxID=309886 RepID=UPI0003769A4F|nr:SDR family NAD(P)-dependent oxidoreductase [Deinococcus apachensis]
MDNRSLNGKVALVTGSSRGIGAAIAREFARHGAGVVLHGRDEAALERVRADIAAAGGRAICVVADVTRFAEIEAMRRRAEADLGPVDILVANAGGSFTPPAPLEDISEEGWHAAVNGNLTATFLTLKSFLPGMKARGSGSIITLSSSAGRQPHPGAPMPYGAAKAGVQLLTQDLAAQVGPCGIRVNGIAPGTILTERNEARIPEELRGRWTDAHPLRRLGTPQDVADAALYLASDAAGWVTGVILDVAGGAVLR